MRTERRLSVRIRPAAWRRQRTGPGALPGLSLRTLFAVGVDQEPQLLDVNAVLLIALWLDAVLKRPQEFLPCHHHLSATRVLSWVISTGRTIGGIAPGPAPLVPDEPKRRAFDLLNLAAAHDPAGPKAFCAVPGAHLL